MLKRLPNILTLSRILVLPALVGVFYYFQPPLGNYLAFAIYAYAGITDFFDGYVARTYGATSKLGQFMDPVADKLLIAITIVLLIAFDRIAGVHVVAAMIILAREILVSGLREFLAGLRVGVPVTILAKWKTFIQIIALGAFLLWDAAPWWLFPIEVAHISLWAAALLTILTGYDYLKAGLAHMD